MALKWKSKLEVTPEMVSRVMSEMGRRGGKIGGPACRDSLTPQQRHDRAVKAVTARWAKHRLDKSKEKA